MIYLNSLDKIDLKNTALTIGKFEAIHKGHKKLIDAIVDKKIEGLTACVLSIKTSDVGIYTIEERKYIFEKLGIDILIELELDEIKNIAYNNFIDDIIIKKMDAKYVACGEDFIFGNNRLGNALILKKSLLLNDIHCDIFEKIYHKDNKISSSFIKEYILNGNIIEVNEMLSEKLFVYGTVVKGNQIGRTIGVPTANILWSKNKILPPKGVYASKVYVDRRKFYGIANIGVKPTIANNNDMLIETNIFNFNENIYGKKIFVFLYKFMRKEQKYSSVYELEEIIKKDIYDIKKMYNIT